MTACSSRNVLHLRCVAWCSSLRQMASALTCLQQGRTRGRSCRRGFCFLAGVVGCGCISVTRRGCWPCHEHASKGTLDKSRSLNGDTSRRNARDTCGCYACPESPRRVSIYARTTISTKKQRMRTEYFLVVRCFFPQQSAALHQLYNGTSNRNSNGISHALCCIGWPSSHIRFKFRIPSRRSLGRLMKLLLRRDLKPNRRAKERDRIKTKPSEAKPTLELNAGDVNPSRQQ